MNKKNNKIIYTILLVIFIFIIIIGTSYAIFSYYRNGTSVNQFYTADIMYKFKELENFELKNVYPESFEYGSTQEDNIVSFSLNGNVQTGVLDYSISVIKGNDIQGKTRLPEEALLISIESDDESSIFVTVDAESNNLEEGVIYSDSLEDLITNTSKTLASGFLTPTSSIEHETFYVRIWVNDEKVMISDTICRNEITKKAQNCNTSYIDEEGDTINTYPYEDAYTNNMYIFRTNELENYYYSIKVNVDSNL